MQDIRERFAWRALLLLVFVIKLRDPLQIVRGHVAILNVID